jgi:hypothetical protein
VPNLTPEAALTTPADPRTDRVSGTRRALREMGDRAERATDDQVARSDADGAAEVAMAPQQDDSITLILTHIRFTEPVFRSAETTRLNNSSAQGDGNDTMAKAAYKLPNVFVGCPYSGSFNFSAFKAALDRIPFRWYYADTGLTTKHLLGILTSYISAASIVSSIFQLGTPTLLSKSVSQKGSALVTISC